MKLRCIISGLFVTLMAVAQAWFLAKSISMAFVSGFDRISFYYLLAWFLVFSLLKAIAISIQEYSSSLYGLRAKEKVRTHLIRELLSFGFRTIPKEDEGELVSTLTNEIDSLEAYFTQYIPAIWLGIISPIIIIIFIFYFDIYSGLILAVTAPLIPIFMVLVGRKAEKMTEKQWKVLGYLSSYFLDTLQGLTTLKVFGRSKDRIQKISEITEEFRLATMKTLKVAFVSSLTIELVSTLSIAIVAVGIGLRLVYGNMDYLTALFILILAPEFYYPLRNLAAKFHSGMQGKIAKKKIAELELNALPLEKETLIAQLKTAALHSIEFCNVNFSYDNGISVISNLSFKIEQGQIIGLKGKSGSGKTTLIKLIVGLLSPTSGTILYDGIESQNFDKQLYGYFACVPQQPYIFNKSIKDNILFGSEFASDSELKYALEISCLDDFVKSLKNGLDTIIGERGMNLSGGQIQKIAIARAVLKNAPVLILDEATSSIDVMCEEKLVENIRRFTESKTVILAAHRSGILKNLDIIIDTDCENRL